ncbi:hypothetical protein NPIL_704091 [Nephila pilipes]|uniref:Uncharacterized protein n=1 Tax=Nephila pilipes TaxID=299642 RepID=A0A8X6J3T4_NEPPI|nr:hypothetical protein NPIL_704091 [Nephila pilipes]
MEREKVYLFSEQRKKEGEKVMLGAEEESVLPGTPKQITRRKERDGFMGERKRLEKFCQNSSVKLETDSCKGLSGQLNFRLQRIRVQSTCSARGDRGKPHFHEEPTPLSRNRQYG